MKFFEIAEAVVAEKTAVTFFPTTTPGEFATKDLVYTADRVEGLQVEDAAPKGKARRPRCGVLLDLFSASAYVAVRKALNEDNRAKYDALAAKSPTVAVKVAFKLLKGSEA